MPKAKVDNIRKAPGKVKRPIATTSEIGNNDSIHSEEEMNDALKSPNGSDTDSKKSLIEVEEEIGYPQDFSGGMSKLLERFSTDLNKTMFAKRKKLEQFTQESTRTTTRKIIETNKMQSAERRKLIDHFQNQMNSVIQQGESELEKLKDGEDKLHKALLQQQKHQQQIRIAHNQRLKALKNLGEEFCKGMNELETSHVDQYSAVHGELKKEMAFLQKKILMDIQQQEMMNVRKHLKQILP